MDPSQAGLDPSQAALDLAKPGRVPIQVWVGSNPSYCWIESNGLDPI